MVTPGELEDYLEAHTTPEPENLRALERRVNLHLLYPRMCSGKLQGRVLSMLTSMISPLRALEIGTYAGYSALCIAEGLPPGGHLDTVEIDDEMEDFIRHEFAQSPYGERIMLHIGDAGDVLPQLAFATGFQPYDMAYIDANKRIYLETYEQVLPLLRPGGFLLADNTLWDGKVLDGESRDAQTRGLMAFNDFVVSDPRVSVVMLPLRDGLTLIRKNS